MHRRTVLAGGLGLLCAGMAPALPVPAGDRLSFRIIRKGSAIGTHVVDFTRDSDALTVNVAVDIAVGFGPIVLYRYTHRATEHWRGVALNSMHTETTEDGKHTRL